jgi:hypothetical protein
MKAARFVLTMVTFAVALFAAYTIGLAAIGLFSIDIPSPHAWRILTTDSAGISYLTFILLDAVPIAAAFTGLLLPLLGYLWFDRLRVAVIGGLVLLVSVFQIPAQMWIVAKLYGPINLEVPFPPMAAAMRLAGLTAFNFMVCLLVCALRWGIRPRKLEVLDRTT